MNTSAGRYRWYIFTSLACLYFLVYFQRVSPAVIAFDLMRDFEAGGAVLGLMSAAYFYSYALVQIPIGVLSDSFGPRKTVALFSLIAFFGTILFAFAQDVVMLSTGRALIGFGVGGVFIPALKIIAEWFHANEFATLNGMLVAVGNFGGLVASAPLALLTVLIGWRNSFALIAIITLILTVIAWSVVRDSPLDMEIERGCKENYEMRRAISIIFRNKDFWMLAIVAFLSYGTLMSFQGLWGGPFLIEIYGFDKATAGSVLMFIGIGMIIGCPLGGFISDRLLARRKPVFVAGLGIYTLAWVPLAFFTDKLNFASLSIVCFSLGLSFGVFFIMMTIAKEMFSGEIVGTALGSVNIFFFLGAASYQSAIGYHLSGGYGLIFKFCFVSMLIAFLASIVFREQRAIKNYMFN